MITLSIQNTSKRHDGGKVGAYPISVSVNCDQTKQVSPIFYLTNRREIVLYISNTFLEKIYVLGLAKQNNFVQKCQPP